MSARFRGGAATPRSQHLAAAGVVSAICVAALIGIIVPVTAMAFLAVGAGAGYSLSGSV